MKDFLKILKNKLKQDDDHKGKIEDRFVSNFRKEFSDHKVSIWESIQIRNIVAACLLLVATITFMNREEQDQNSSKLTSMMILEKEVLLSNMELMDELDEFENLTDEDWDILLGEAAG